MGYANADHEQTVLDEALAALKKTTGLKATVVEREIAAAGQQQLDARIEIVDDDGKRFPLLVEIKTRIDREAALGAACAQIRRLGEQGVLVTPYLAPKLADHCRDDLKLDALCPTKHDEAIHCGGSRKIPVAG